MGNHSSFNFLRLVFILLKVQMNVYEITYVPFAMWNIWNLILCYLFFFRKKFNWFMVWMQSMYWNGSWFDSNHLPLIDYHTYFSWLIICFPPLSVFSVVEGHQLKSQFTMGLSKSILFVIKKGRFLRLVCDRIYHAHTITYPHRRDSYSLNV